MQCSLQGSGLWESPLNISYPLPPKLLTCGHVPALSAMPSYEFYRHVNKSSKCFFLNPSGDLKGEGA